MPYCEEDEGDTEDQRQHVAEGSKSEHNFRENPDDPPDEHLKPNEEKTRELGRRGGGEPRRFWHHPLLTELLETRSDEPAAALVEEEEGVWVPMKGVSAQKASAEGVPFSGTWRSETRRNRHRAVTASCEEVRLLPLTDRQTD